MNQYYDGMKICFDGNYPEVNFPSHPKARSNGRVYIHILQMEKKLKRPLNDKEVVHHVDNNKENFELENLWCFATNKDHALFHNGGIAIKKGDVYISISTKVHKKCKKCGKIINDLSKKYCIYCYQISLKKEGGLRKVNRPSKEELKELIKTCSFVGIGKIYGVSDNAVRKWCKSYELPYRKQDLI